MVSIYKPRIFFKKSVGLTPRDLLHCSYTLSILSNINFPTCQCVYILISPIVHEWIHFLLPVIKKTNEVTQVSKLVSSMSPMNVFFCLPQQNYKLYELANERKLSNWCSLNNILLYFMLLSIRIITLYI